MSTQFLIDVFTSLSQTPRDWYLDAQGRIRRTGPEGEECPLSSLLDKEVSEANAVGQQLAIPIGDRMGIIYAADRVHRDPNDERNGSLADWFSDEADLATIRHALLHACGLRVENIRSEDSHGPDTTA